MAGIEITADTVVVHITGADRLWSLKSRLEVPIAHIVGVEPATEDARNWLRQGIRIGGTHIPGVLSAGTFYTHGDLVFWDVHDPEKAIALDLADERYARLVIEVDEPAATIAALSRLLPAAGVAR